MELLETTAQSHEIEKIIIESNLFTIIVSPYLKINKRLKPKLSYCFEKNKENLIIYRENQLSNEEKLWFESFKNVKLISIKNLHAKCYLNEKTALITSMNLYDYSQINNHEIGIKITIDKNQNEMIRLLEMIEFIIKTDYSSFDFSRFYNNHENEYTMSRLYSELVNDYEFPEKRNDIIDNTYQYICQIAMKLHKFPEEDLKYDKLSLKRITRLDYKNYHYIKNELIKVGICKIMS